MAIILFAVCITLLGGGVRAEDPTTPSSAPSPAASPATCPVTYPNGNNPEGDSSPGGYGNAWLWTNLFMWSMDTPEVIVPNDSHIMSDGTIREMKWAWHRYVSGTLTVEGRRLDAPSAPLIAWVPEGYGDRGFQVTGLTFPSAGCWEITGRVDGHELTFVTLVIMPDSTATPAPVS
jgi:hypothetical protein